MSGEMNYVHPIIQAMIANNQQGIANRQLQQKSEQDIAENKLRQQQVDQGLKEIEYRHAHETEVDKQTAQARDAEQALNRLQGRLSIVNALKSGAITPQMFQNQQANSPETGATFPATPSDQMDVPGIGRIPVAGVQTPQAAAQQRIQEAEATARAKAAGEGEGSQPTLQANMQFEAGLKSKAQQDENTFKASESQLDRTNKEKIAKLDTNAQLYGHQIAANAQLQVAHIAHDIKPEELQSGVFSLMTGQRTFNSDNPFDRAVMTASQQAGIKPISPKDISALKEGQKLTPTLDKVQDFINNYIPAGEGVGGTLRAMGRKYITGSAIPTDAKNELAEIKTGAMNTARNLEGLTGGRVTQQQMQIFLEGLTDPGITRQQATDRLNNIRNMMVNNENNVILGGVPAQQKAIIYKTEGILPAFLQTAPKTNKVGHKLDVDTSIKEGVPVYSNQ